MNPYEIAKQYTNYEYINVYFSDHISVRLCQCPLSSEHLIICEKSNYRKDEYKIIEVKYLKCYLESYEIITAITAPETIDTTLFLYQL